MGEGPQVSTWRTARYRKCVVPRAAVLPEPFAPLASTSGIAHFLAARRRGDRVQLAGRLAGDTRIRGADFECACRGDLREQRRSRDTAPRGSSRGRIGVPRAVVRTERISHALPGRTLDRDRRVLQLRLAGLGTWAHGRGRLPGHVGA